MALVERLRKARKALVVAWGVVDKFRFCLARPPVETESACGKAARPCACNKGSSGRRAAECSFLLLITSTYCLQ